MRKGIQKRKQTEIVDIRPGRNTLRVPENLLYKCLFHCYESLIIFVIKLVNAPPSG